MSSDVGAAAPLRVLFVSSAPSDTARIDPERAWREIDESLRALVHGGRVVVERVSPATEAALRQRLAQSAWHVAHVVAPAKSHASAQYATLALEGSDGRTRSVTASHLGKLLAGHPSLRVAVLQPAERGVSLAPQASAIAAAGLAAVVTTGYLTDRPQSVFVAKLYAALAGGSSARAAFDEARGALGANAADPACTQIAGRDPDTAPCAAPVSVPPRAEPPPPIAREPREPIDARAEAARRELERKQRAGDFDVFLCHNSADKPAVKRIAEALKRRGILPWLDEWELPPGQPWQPLLERQIGSIRAAAVFFGAANIGPWQEQELYGFLREFVARKSPVIPVLLADAPQAPELPIFLRAMTWVDFRRSDPDPLDRLIWGVTGQRPSEQAR
jgi:hypothetical protein